MKGVGVGLAALLIAAAGLYFCWKTANRHGAMLIASKDRVRYVLLLDFQKVCSKARSRRHNRTLAHHGVGSAAMRPE